MRRHLGLIDQPVVMIAGRIHRRLPASQLGDLPGLAGLGGEVGQPLEGGIIGRLPREDRREG